MAFQVTKWPYSPDPRFSNFNFPGWDFGQVPPWKWIVSTTGATGPEAIYNDGVLLEPADLTPASTRWDAVASLLFDQDTALKILGTELPTGPGPGITKTFELTLFENMLENWQGIITRLYPTAIQVHGGFNMVKTGTPVGTIPNPMFITPVIWNTEPRL